MKARIRNAGSSLALVLCLLGIFSLNSNAQDLTQLGYHDFPFTSNGITVTQSATGGVGVIESSYELCGVNVKAGNFHIGRAGAGTITTEYSSPVNDVRVLIGAAGDGEVLTFAPDNGTLTPVIVEGCGASVSENMVSFSSSGNLVVELHSSAPYTVLRVQHNGASAGAMLTFSMDEAIAAGPAKFTVTGGGAVCSGSDNKKEIGLSGSETGVSYQLKKDGTAVGDPVQGTGNAISFEKQNGTGVYTVTATGDNGTSEMTGSVAITEMDPPGSIAIAAAAAICKGSSTTLMASPPVVYIRTSEREPWSGQSNVTELNSVFGEGGWGLQFFETANPASLFSSGTTVIVMDGSDNGAIELNAFLTANHEALESWVNQGGHILINSAPNEGGDIDFGFDGVTLSNNKHSSTAGIAEGKTNHPIFTGPNSCGTSWTGGSFSHAAVSGGGIVPLITGQQGTILAEKQVGSGLAMFGGMTLTQFHQPSPQASNLRKNIFEYLKAVVPQHLTYAWSPATGLSATDLPVVTASPEATTTYTLVVTNDDGCSKVSTVTVTVNEPIKINSNPANTTVYSGKDAQFAVEASGTDLTYQWQVNSGNGWMNINGANQPSLTIEKVTAEMSGYQYQCVVTGFCPMVTSNAATLTVLTILPGYSINDAEQCATGNSFVFTNETQSGDESVKYHWEFGDGNTSADTNTVHSYEAAGSYTVKLVVETTDGFKDSVSHEIVVNPQPAGQVASAGTIICNGSFVELNTNEATGYQWYKNGTPIDGASAQIYQATDKGDYAVKLISKYGCETMSSNSITMNLVKKPEAAFSFDKYCLDVPVSFNNQSGISESGKVSYAWNFGDDANSEKARPDHIYTKEGAYQVSLTITPDACPELSSAVEKTIRIETPVPGARYNLIDASVGNAVTLKARALDAPVQWFPATDLSTPYSTTTVLNPSKEVDYKIEYRFPSGCTTVDSQLVRIFSADNLFVPRAFTPNGDGVNDVLHVLPVGITKLNYFRVYNRWGALVFETHDLGSGWDGTIHGNKQSADTYIWSAEGIDQKGKLVKRAGSTTLIR